MMEKEHITFNMALHDESLRQRYLDGIDLGSAKSAIKQVLYDPKLTDEAAMAAQDSLGTRLGFKGFRSKVIVGPLAFQREDRECDFLSGLLEHEAKHAEDSLKHPQYMAPSLAVIFLDPFINSTRPIGFNSGHDHLKSRLCCLAERRALHAQLMAHKSGEMPLSTGAQRNILEWSKAFRESTKSLRAERQCLASEIKRTTFIEKIVINPLRHIHQAINQWLISGF